MDYFILCAFSITAVNQQINRRNIEQYLPQVISPWDAKEQRKKLRFTALRGQS